MTKTLHAFAVAFALALITAAFVIVLAACDRATSPVVPPRTGAVPVPPVTFTTEAQLPAVRP